ncbi:SP_0009 family protein [Streptococcus halichoeri]|nr:SP_0009 family protein [Streptococcus halichoeri]
MEDILKKVELFLAHSEEKLKDLHQQNQSLREKDPKEEND